MEAVRRMQSGESASALARELEVKRSKLYDWCAAWERYGEQAFPGPGRRPAARRVSNAAAKARPSSPRWSAKSANRPSRSIF